ncbi:MAG: HigA family addiction module antidote protein [Acidobacteriota bacterium]|nr:HigA family addiction module antidote protein [Acidobacteriota bacterium]
MGARLKPVHPGEILREEFIEPLGLNPHKVSLALRVSAPTVSEITHEKRSVSPDVALRLARYFNTTPEFWLNLQTRYDLEVARDEEEAAIKREVQPLKNASAR